MATVVSFYVRSYRMNQQTLDLVTSLFFYALLREWTSGWKIESNQAFCCESFR